MGPVRPVTHREDAGRHRVTGAEAADLPGEQAGHRGPAGEQGAQRPGRAGRGQRRLQLAACEGRPAGRECRGTRAGMRLADRPRHDRGDGTDEHVAQRPAAGHVLPGGHQHEVAGAAEQLPGAAGQVGGEVGAAQVHGDAVREQYRGRGQPGRYPVGQGRAGRAAAPARPRRRGAGR